uniref:Putative Lactosylceramide n=1 Tax=Daphnia magna TaxID=35525 RepID=A0A0P5SX70_9CRUS
MLFDLIKTRVMCALIKFLGLALIFLLVDLGRNTNHLVWCSSTSMTIQKCHFEWDDYFNRNYLQLNDYVSYNVRSDVPNFDPTRDELCDQGRSPKLVKEYSQKDLVHCFDFLSEKRNRRPMHIAFIGDSTVRQFFFTFLGLIPDYDRAKSIKKTAFAQYVFHDDGNVTSRILDNLLVSFYWRNLIRNDLIADFKRWASTENINQVPDFILLETQEW